MQAIPVRIFYRLLPALVTAAGIALFVHLGNWQAQKGAARAAEAAAFEARSHATPTVLTGVLRNPAQLQGAPVVVRGRYLADQQVYLDNQQDHGRAGVQVITPLLIEGSTVRVLINRGWAPWGQSRADLPVAPPPTGDVVVTGSAIAPVVHSFFLMPDRADVNPHIWHQIDLAHYAAIAGGPVQALVILQNQGDAPDTLVRQWPPPEDRVAMHRSYAWQWYVWPLRFLYFSASQVGVNGSLHDPSARR